MPFVYLYVFTCTTSRGVLCKMIVFCLPLLHEPGLSFYVIDLQVGAEMIRPFCLQSTRVIDFLDFQNTFCIDIIFQQL